LLGAKVAWLRDTTTTAMTHLPYCTAGLITAGRVLFITQPYRFVTQVNNAISVVSAIFRGTIGVRLPLFNAGTSLAVP